MSELPGGNGRESVKKYSMLPAVPLDLRCHGENSRATSSQRGYAVTVSRRCAPPLVPSNTAPSTSLPRGAESSIVTTMKVNRRHSTSDQTAEAAPAVVNLSRRRSRDSAGLMSAPEMLAPVQKLARLSSQVPTHTGPIASSATCVQVIPSDDKL